MTIECSRDFPAIFPQVVEKGRVSAWLRMNRVPAKLISPITSRCLRSCEAIRSGECEPSWPKLEAMVSAFGAGFRSYVFNMTNDGASPPIRGNSMQSSRGWPGWGAELRKLIAALIVRWHFKRANFHLAAADRWMERR